jgi:hypothetical protein
MNMAARSLVFYLAGVSLWAQAPAPGGAAFDSPQAAVQALIDAAEKNDSARIAEVFGPNSKELLTAGDPARDRAEREEFCSLVHRKHVLHRSTLNSHVMILTVGEEEWPFPVPLVESNGKWRFDAMEGRMEMRARQIGSNELDAIEICAGYVGAQHAYATRVRDEHGLLEYAQQIMSSAGKQDGLYWTGSGALAPEAFAQAESRGAAAKPKAYHGYYFRVLKSQGPDAPGGAYNYVTKDSMIGGFALVAWPAQYGVTGIHTFIVNQDGVVYERDNGAGAPPLTQYNPDKSWMPVE